MTRTRVLVVAVLAVAVVVAVMFSTRRPAPTEPSVDPTTILSADRVVETAVAEAREGGKIVLIEFGASWCVWCRNFQSFVHAPEVKDILARNYVITTLTVREREEKVALENAGGSERMREWGGAESGLPFYVFLDAQGRKIADSNVMPGGTNIGFPATSNELEAFMTLIDKTAPRLEAAERQTIFDYLNKSVQKQASSL